jgi:ubiquitin-activating enzyme E1
MLSDFMCSIVHPFCIWDSSAAGLLEETAPVAPGDMEAAVDQGGATRPGQDFEDNAAERTSHLSVGIASRARSCAALGGMVGQVLKACSGKFSINGFFILMPTKPARYCAGCCALGAAQQSVRQSDCRLGKEQERLLDLQYFIIGAGAIGCEMLKNCSLCWCGLRAQGTRLRDDMGRKVQSVATVSLRSSDIDEFEVHDFAAAAKAANPVSTLPPPRKGGARDRALVW